MEDEEKKVCIVGDFNAIVSLAEKAGGSSKMTSANRAFWDWVYSMGLIDLGHHGLAFTWSNKQVGRANIAQRLDRAMASLKWTMDFLILLCFICRDLKVIVPQFSSKQIQSGFDKVSILSARTGGCCVMTSRMCVEEQSEKGGNDWVAAGSFKQEVTKWAKVKKTLDVMLSEIELHMLDLNSKLVTEDTKDWEREL